MGVSNSKNQNQKKEDLEIDVSKIEEIIENNTKEELKNLIFGLIFQIQKQNEEIEKLKDQIAKNRSNSGKPPSSDGYSKKPANLRKFQKAKGKKNGGQKGHKGDTLKQVEEPDEIEKCEVTECEHCKGSLVNTAAIGCEKRQVFDIPPMKITVKEYQSEIKKCPNCSQKTKGVFPEKVGNRVQYGARIKSFASYFNSYHFIPLARTSEIFFDLFNHTFSEASVIQANEELAEKTNSANETIKQELINSNVVHFDESGMRVAGKLHWAHVASTPNFTYYDIHKKRGSEAIDDIGILPNIKGTGVHDHWKPYYKYKNCNHGLCNAHHLRELIFILERYEQAWSEKMINCLLEIKKVVEKAKDDDFKKLSPEIINKFEVEYEKIIMEGFLQNPPPKSAPKKKRGRIKQTKPKNLLDRLCHFRKDVLAFMYDFNVPFDNNLPERDIRMVKVKQKVSGAFRTFDGSKTFCKIRSYISSVRKNSCNVIEAIQNAFYDNPWHPNCYK